MKQTLCLLLAFFCLMPFPARGEAAWDSLAWAEVSAALTSDEENPVPETRRLPPPDQSRPPLEEWIRVLLLSTDSSDLARNFGRTDAVFVCAVHRETGEIRLAALPEDEKITVSGLPEEVRLKYVNCFGGPLWTARALREAWGLSVSRYCAVNFSAFEQIIDGLGGVSLSLTASERAALGVAEENVRLNGAQALRYVRLRRQETGESRPQRLLEAVLNAALSGRQTEDLLALVDALLPAIDTNLSMNDLMDLAFVLGGQQRPSVRIYRLPAGENEGPLPEEIRACRMFLEGKEDAP